MKTSILSLFLFLSFSITAQITYIPDSIFEQKLINLGYDNIHDGSVATDSINSIDSLDISSVSSIYKIYDLSGIEDFYNLQYLNCSNNHFSTLNLNNNSNLKYIICTSDSIETLQVDNLFSLQTLVCNFNLLDSLDLSGNPGLTNLNCLRNELTTLDLSNNTFLATVSCGENQITTLDLSLLNLESLQCQNNPISSINLQNNYSLKHLTCHDNLLQSIDLSDNVNLEWLSIGNGNLIPPTFNNDLNTLDLSTNYNITNLYCNNNLNLYCIQVYDTSLINNWTYNIDVQQYFSENCNYTAVDESIAIKGKLIAVKDIFGREVNNIKQHDVLFYIYENNRVEKRILLDN